MNVFRIEDNCLKFHYDAEELWIQPWSANSFRVRACKTAQMPCENWALRMDQKRKNSGKGITVRKADLL